MTHSHHKICSVHHVCHSSDIEQRIILAKQSCQAQGVRFTPLREQVFRLVLQAKAPIGAYELLAQLQEQQKDKCLAPPTVYRSLDFLLAHGFIHQLSSTNAFIACSQPCDKHVAAFLICQHCHQVQELSVDSISYMLSSVTKQTNFVVKTSVIEITGFCENCQ